MAKRTPRPRTARAGVEDALVAGILERDDDAARLVYADWLLDQGGDRALRGELIQVECRLAVLGPLDADRSVLEARRARLVEVTRSSWDPGLAELPSGLPATWGMPTWTGRVTTSRGFPAHLSGGDHFYLRMFVHNAKVVFDRMPFLDGIEVRLAREDAAAVAKLVAMPELARFRRLGLRGDMVSGLGTAGLARLLRSRHRPRALEALSLRGAHIGDAGLVQLAASPMLDSVRYLDLTHNDLGAKGLVALARSPHVRSLTTLLVMDNPIGIKAARELAASPQLGRLVELAVGAIHTKHRVDDDGRAVLEQRFSAALIDGGTLERRGLETIDGYSGLTRRRS